MPGLWNQPGPAAWRRALDRYDDVVAAQGVPGLSELDAWYREALPAAIAGRDAAYVTLEELVRVTEWKMKRGVWRARNLALVKGNTPGDVVSASRAALAAAPDPRAPIAGLATLAGVGPATASAVAAAACPAVYPFLDDVAAAGVPGLGDVAYTLPYYVRYAAALRERAAALGGDWTPVLVERALWAGAGGKAGDGTPGVTG
jgi:hypothetical protein